MTGNILDYTPASIENIKVGSILFSNYNGLHYCKVVKINKKSIRVVYLKHKLIIDRFKTSQTENIFHYDVQITQDPFPNDNNNTIKWNTKRNGYCHQDSIFRLVPENEQEFMPWKISINS